MEEPLLAYRTLLKDSKTSDKELKEYTRQIIDSTATLIQIAEAEIKRLNNETEDTDKLKTMWDCRKYRKTGFPGPVMTRLQP